MAAVNKLAKREPITKPIRKTAKIGRIIDVIGGGKLVLYTSAYIMKKVMITQSMHTKSVRKMVRVPPILKNRCLFIEKVSVAIWQL